jgi:hypothetical protein
MKRWGESNKRNKSYTHNKYYKIAKYANTTFKLVAIDTDKKKIELILKKNMRLLIMHGFGIQL